MTSSSGAAIANLLERTTRAIYSDRGPQHMHPGQWAMLRYLASTDPRNRTASAISEHFDITHAPVSRSLANLASKNLVTIRRDAEDRRVRLVDPTPNALTLLAGDPILRLGAAIERLDSNSQRELACTVSALHVFLTSSD